MVSEIELYFGSGLSGAVSSSGLGVVSFRLAPSVRTEDHIAWGCGSCSRSLCLSFLLATWLTKSYAR